MLKHVTALLLLAGMLGLPATAGADGPGPIKWLKFGVLRVHNAVDDAVETNLRDLPLEPNETASFTFWLNSQRETVDVTASLVSDPSITATETVVLQNGKITDATVRFVPPSTLLIEVAQPKKDTAK